MSDEAAKSIRLASIDQALDDQAASGRPPASPPELVSVVVPCLGQLEYTWFCVPSLLRHSRRHYELVFADVDSLDGTAAYLDGLRAAAPVLVEIVRIREERGLPAACDEAFARAHGQFVVLLGNDTIVPPGWLEQLVALASFDPAIGAVGPMSNHANPPQLVPAIPYRLPLKRAGVSSTPPRPDEATDPVEVVARFAATWRDEHRGQWFEAESLDPFCVLFKREALEALGPFERWSGRTGFSSQLRPFDADQLGLRLRRAGIRLACCNDLFVHHFGSRTPLTSGIRELAQRPILQ